MVGVILCGGQSTRMGSDKGLLSTDGISWAQDAINKGKDALDGLFKKKKNKQEK